MGDVDHLASELERLAASADRIARLQEEMDAEHTRRDDLIVGLRDGGKSWRTIARHARLSVSRCVAIVTGG